MRQPNRVAMTLASCLALAACGGGGPSAPVTPPATVTSGCLVAAAGQCATITTAQATWDAAGGAAAWARQCTTGGSTGQAGTVVADCPAEGRVGRCDVSYSSGSSSAVAVYGYYAPTYGTAQATEACAVIHGAFTDG